MKRILSALLIMAFVASMTACANQPIASSEPEALPQEITAPSAEPESTPEPTPEPSTEPTPTPSPEATSAPERFPG